MGGRGKSVEILLATSEEISLNGSTNVRATPSWLLVSRQPVDLPAKMASYRPTHCSCDALQGMHGATAVEAVPHSFSTAIPTQLVSSQT